MKALVSLLIGTLLFPFSQFSFLYNTSQQLSPALLINPLITNSVSADPVLKVPSLSLNGQSMVDEIIVYADRFIQMGEDIADARERAFSGKERVVVNILSSPLVSIFFGAIGYGIAFLAQHGYIPFLSAQYIQQYIEYAASGIGFAVGWYIHCKLAKYKAKKIQQMRVMKSDMSDVFQKKLKKFVRLFSSSYSELVDLSTNIESN